MPNPLTIEKREELYETWLKVGFVTVVAKACDVSAGVCRKYRLKDKWDERKEKVRVEVRRKNDGEDVKRKIRHIKMSQLLQARGAEKLNNSKSIKKPSDAIRAIEAGVHLEREITGDDDGSKGKVNRIIIEYVD